MRILSMAGCVIVMGIGCADPQGDTARKSDLPIGDHPKSPAKKTDGNANDKHPITPQFANDDGYALPRERFEAGWIRLFDGRTLFGWTANSDANWRVKDGVLVADAGKAGLLVTNVPFADYELRCEYRLEKGGNSGLFLRTVFQPTNPAVDCYELNICDTHKTHPTGSLVARKVAGVKVVKEGEWLTYVVTVQGKRISVQLDGKQVLDYTDDEKTARRIGFIGLQFREGRIEFRNVLLKPLGTKAIFNGKNLSSWNIVAGKHPGNVNVNVADGTIHIKGGSSLESQSEWGDFLLQAGVRTNAKDVNSGIFFRTMKTVPKQSPNGYELQICNRFAGGDRTKPNDYGSGFGTGAIFRRQKARRVIPDDNEWCTLTLVAYGNRFASWVNGYQVADFRDERPPDQNPRKGTRLKSGRFNLQGHDPTTDVSFRNLRVGTLPEAADANSDKKKKGAAKR
ncbi:MAG: DUF1080 domain-containing protein [Planctomycetaceae bacterium]